MKRKTAIIVTANGYVFTGYVAAIGFCYEWEDPPFHLEPHFDPDPSQAFVFDSPYYAQRAIDRIIMHKNSYGLSFKPQLAVVS